jgi:hypothetical protein
LVGFTMPALAGLADWIPNFDYRTLGSEVSKGKTSAEYTRAVKHNVHADTLGSGGSDGKSFPVILDAQLHLATRGRHGHANDGGVAMADRIADGFLGNPVNMDYLLRGMGRKLARKLEVKRDRETRFRLARELIQRVSKRAIVELRGKQPVGHGTHPVGRADQLLIEFVKLRRKARRNVGDALGQDSHHEGDASKHLA